MEPQHQGECSDQVEPVVNAGRTSDRSGQGRETGEVRSHARDMANVADSPTNDQGRAGAKAEGGKQSDRPDREPHEERAPREGEPRGKGDDAGRDKGGHDAGDRGRGAHAPSVVRVLLFSGLVALVGGVAGGWGYSSFFSSQGAGKESSDKHAAAKQSSDSSTKKRAGEAESTKESRGQSKSGEEVPAPTRPGELDTLREQIEDLAKQVSSLGERFDSLSLPRDQTPPELRKLQVKVIDLAHAVERMDDPPTHLRHIDDRLEELHQQLKALQSQITGHQENTRGATAPSAKPPAHVRSKGVTSAP